MTEHTITAIEAYNDVPLPKYKSCIRLLRVNAKAANGTIGGELYVYPIDKAPPFVALSYVWGTDEATESIQLDEHVFPVRPNLRAFLARYLEHVTRAPYSEQIYPTSTRYGDLLWIDAICINQEDDEERSEQVKLMGEIYSKAHWVLVWLGDYTSATPHGSIADAQDFFHFWPLLDTYNSLDAAGAKEAEVRSLCRDNSDEIDYILKNPYWTRMWVVPECFLSVTSVKTVLWGNKWCTWDNLDHLSFKIRRFDHGNVDSSAHPGRALRLKSLDRSSGSRFLASRYLFNPRKRSGTPAELIQLLQDTKDMQCREPRDRVYALLSLCENTITVDYTQSNEQLLSQILFHMFKYRMWIENFKNTHGSEFALEMTLESEGHMRKALEILTKILPVNEEALVRLHAGDAPVPLGDIDPFKSFLERQRGLSSSG